MIASSTRRRASVGEDDRAQRRPVEVAVRRSAPRARTPPRPRPGPACPARPPRGPARRRRSRPRPSSAQERRDRALARGDPAGESDPRPRPGRGARCCCVIAALSRTDGNPLFGGVARAAVASARCGAGRRRGARAFRTMVRSMSQDDEAGARPRGWSQLTTAPLSSTGSWRRPSGSGALAGMRAARPRLGDGLGRDGRSACRPDDRAGKGAAHDQRPRRTPTAPPGPTPVQRCAKVAGALARARARRPGRHWTSGRCTWAR